MLFKALQKNQCQAAKHKLSAAPGLAQDLREFDLDIAKFLYAVVPCYGNGPVF